MGGCPNLPDFFTNPVSAWNFAPFVWRTFLFVVRSVLRIFLPLRQSLPFNLVREKTIVFSVSALCHCCQRLLCHDWKCMSLLWNSVHVPSTENTLTLSSERMLSFLFDSWWLILGPQHRSGLWSLEFWSSDQYVLQLSSIVNHSAFHYLEQFLDRTKPRQSEIESCNFDLFNPCRIISKGSISLTDNSAWSHLTSKSWTSSVCKLIVKQVWESLYCFTGSGCTEYS